MPQATVSPYFRFGAVWWELVREGVCDALDSAEWVRIIAAWESAGRPPQIAEFIRREANRPASEGRAG